jgi:hypothetical protein
MLFFHSRHLNFAPFSMCEDDNRPFPLRACIGQGVWSVRIGNWLLRPLRITAREASKKASLPDEVISKIEFRAKSVSVDFEYRRKIIAVCEIIFAHLLVFYHSATKKATKTTLVYRDHSQYRLELATTTPEENVSKRKRRSKYLRIFYTFVVLQL